MPLEDEKDHNRNMFFTLMRCDGFVGMMSRQYPSAAMRALANGAYSPETASRFVFFPGSEWQFASVKVDVDVDEPSARVGFNYASDAHKIRTSQK